MKHRLVLIPAAALMLSGCGMLLQSNTHTTDTGISAGKVDSGISSSSKDSYSPTASDMNRYGDDTNAWLNASVPNYSQYRNAAVIVDDKVVTDLSAVKLSKVKKVTLFEKAPALKSGEKSTHGAIVITTK